MNAINNRYLINIFESLKKDGKFSSRLKENLRSKYPEEYKYLVNKYTWCKNFKEIYFCVLCNINSQPVCKVCGKPVKFNGTIDKPYNTFCSNNCYKSKEGQEIYWKKYKETCLNKYGVEYYVQTSNFFKSREKTFIDNYGVSYTQKLDKVKEKQKIHVQKNTVDLHQIVLKKLGKKCIILHYHIMA